MIQFLLILLGFGCPNQNVNTTNDNPTSIISHSNMNLGEGSDTGGETQPIPPKK
jgi:hypothetical protein